MRLAVVVEERKLLGMLGGGRKISLRPEVEGIVIDDRRRRSWGGRILNGCRGMGGWTDGREN